MCDEQLPDGVMRMYEDGCGHFAESDECVTLINTPRDIRPITVVEGHGRAREMLIDARGVVYTNEAAAMAAHVYGRTQQRPGEMKRVIVIVMDNAATPQKGHQP